MKPRSLTRIIQAIGLLGLLIVIVVLTHYRFNFGSELSNSQSVWAAFGDYIGGFVGTILAFLSLIALLLTISAQLTEMRETRKQMEEMKQAQEKATRYAELNALIELQDRYSRFMEGWGKKLSEDFFQGEGAIRVEHKVATLDGKIREIEKRIEKIYAEDFEQGN